MTALAQHLEFAPPPPRDGVRSFGLAVLAYNRFSRDIDRVSIKLETFIEEFSNILQRN
ncbi:MAG: hypothetical protein RL509_828, partial [Pseudomonadota bacterium]